MSFAVIVCPHCRGPWAVESRHAEVSCPSCRTRVELAHRVKLWEGTDARQARRQAAQHRTQMADATVAASVSRYQPLAKVARHDSAAEEAAAAARGIANKGSRAEMVAATLDHLRGPMPHAELVQSLQLAGLQLERAEIEVARMLAMDILMEPKAGQYRVLG